MSVNYKQYVILAGDIDDLNEDLYENVMMDDDDDEVTQIQ